MKNEWVYFLKLCLESGLTDSFDCALDRSLDEEDPLSDLVLALSTCGGNRNEQTHILNDYVAHLLPEQIDREAVFSLILDDLKARYERDPNELEQITRWMYRMAWYSGWWNEEPWNTMLFMNDYYYYWHEGILTEALFMESFTALLYQGIPINPMQK